MAYCARTVEDISKGKTGAGALIEVDGVKFGPRMKRYGGSPDPEQPRLVDSKGRAFGAPTRAMKDDNRLWLETLTGLPWPGSACDRYAKGKCADGMANALAGAKSPFGEWPDAREKVCQSNELMARTQPVERMEAILKQRPYRDGEKATLRARAQAMSLGADPDAFETDALDVEALMSAPSAIPHVVASPTPEPARKRAAAGG